MHNRHFPRYLWITLAVVAFSSVLPAFAREAAPSAPVGSWAFDDVKGRLAPDGSGQANQAMIAAGRLVKGVRGAGLELDGRATSARCANAPSLSPTEALSIEAWVKLHALDPEGFPAVVRKEEAYGLRFSAGRLGFILWQRGAPVVLTGEKHDWKTGRWYHPTATYDGRRMRLFVDGAEDARSPKAHSGSIDASRAELGIGSSVGQHRLHGVIDEVRLFDRALGAEEINKSYAAGLRSLEAERNTLVEPREINGLLADFRKPPRKITMVRDGYVWIDAEDFADYGGWWLDTQFVHLMGSGYLIAAGVGKPVEDATVGVDVPTAGTWRVWVRAKNWLKGHSPGQFKVRVGDRPGETVFGTADSEDWLWQSAGDFKLKKGRTRIALCDQTGYYGRCDALVLTTDLDYEPPAAVEDIQKERSRLTGLSLEPQPAGEYDVIVVGAGAAGSCAAVASARQGARTLLVQNRPVLGGNASIELGVPICGAAAGQRNAREGGIIEEAGRIRVRYGYPKMSEPLRMMAEQEKNLTVVLNRHVFDVEMDGKGRIAAVKAVHTLTGRIETYRGRMFLDATGDGWVGFFAGAEYRRGRESRREFGEDLAPDQPDKITMSGCLMGRRALSYRAEDMGRPVEYAAPPWAAKLPPPEVFGRKPRGFVSGQWWLEHEGTIDDLDDAEKARDELIRITFGYWNYIKNGWPERARAARHALTYVPIGDAKRESRRLVGDHVLTQNDVMGARVFADRVSYGGWSLDVHHPRGIYSGLEGPFDFNPRVPLYTIPLRCLYSRNIDNLLMAGRNASVTHTALGTVRVQGTLAALGQAAGTAAAMCVELKTTPRGLYQNHVSRLQQTLLKNDQYIPGIVNEDPGDLARRAAVTASSTARHDLFGRGKVRRGRDLHSLNMPRAVMFPAASTEKLESVFLLLASKRKEPIEATLHLRAARAGDDFSSTKDVATSTAVVAPGRESFVEFKLGARLDTPYAWAWLEPAEGVFWRLAGRAPIGFCRAYGRDASGWTPVESQLYAFYTSPSLGVARDYRPEFATNGAARIVGQETNQWVSDPAGPLPQWIELTWPEVVEINTVHLTFDTDMNERNNATPAIVPQSVRDYELSVFDGKAWKPLVAERGNFQRRRVHRFAAVTTSKLRLTVTATNGDPSARVFEIRVYRE